MAEMNPMQKIHVDRLVINIGSGSDDKVQSNARRLLEIITSRKPMDARAKRRLPAFKVSKGQKIGAFVTVRGDDIKPLVMRLFEAVDNKLKDSAVTNNSVSFGIHEYIDIRGVKYDPKVGMLGMNVNLSFKRKGTRIAERKRKRGTIAPHHRIVSREDIRDYLKNEFNVEVS